MSTRASILLVSLAVFSTASAAEEAESTAVRFDARSVRNGAWSEAKTWSSGKVPGRNARVLVSRGTDVRYDVSSEAPIRLLQVAGALRFSRDVDTLLVVGVLKVQDSEKCSESGFACDFLEVNERGEPRAPRPASLPLLEVGTLDAPIPASRSARIRLKNFEGFDDEEAPALVCCSARMELHGAPMSRTWLDLGARAEAGDKHVVLSKKVSGWSVGDDVIVTGSERLQRTRTFRDKPESVTTERRRIAAIDGTRITLDRALEHAHQGAGRYRSEVANLSRNVVVESADPDGVRGHTIYHRFSQGGISYARFAHLGKERVLGRYAIHFHLVGDTMRGSGVIGASIVDSHNRWITVHGTHYLVIRDCVGYQSVGHGFFLEDGTEVYNLLDRNLGVHAYRGRRMRDQALPFDPNDGAAFWWANGKNALVRNTSCENDEYGYRFDIQRRSNFDSRLDVRQADGKTKKVDVRTIPFWRFEGNEAHTEGLYGVALAGTDGVGPDTRHPHVVRDLTIWQSHYGLRAQIPTMLVENVRIDHAAYGIYRPWFENHVYRDLTIAYTNTEPFNRGLDDRSTQHGSITVDGLKLHGVRRSGMPLIQISANNLPGDAESHFRNVEVSGDRRGRALVNLGGGPRLEPETETSVPIYIHDHYGPGQHAKVVSTRAKNVRGRVADYRSDPPLTGDESRVETVTNVGFPKLLDPVDDEPPATIVLESKRRGDKVWLRGVSHDNGEIARVVVSGHEAKISSRAAGVVDWEIEVPASAARIRPGAGLLSKPSLIAHAEDEAGNVEKTGHVVKTD